MGHDGLFSVPAGISFGRVVTEENLRLHPYVTPKVQLDAHFRDDDEEGDDLELGLAIDLGLDLAFQGSWTVRLGASLGDREAVAAGVAFPFAFRD